MSSQLAFPENEARLFHLFKTAVKEERKAEQLYARALSLCTDSCLRPILQELIDYKRRQEQILIDRYNALAGRGLADCESGAGTGEYAGGDRQQG
jgi:hypothetical protein